MQNEPQLSKCCHAPTKLNTLDSFDSPEGQTMYTICTKCEKPCDPVGGYSWEKHSTGEPQLSAEIKERFELARRRMSPIVDLDQNPPVEYAAVTCSSALAELDDLEKLLATALEEQKAAERTKTITEMLELLVDKENIANYSVGQDGFIKGFNKALSELRAKLEAMNEGKGVE